MNVWVVPKDAQSNDDAKSSPAACAAPTPDSPLSVLA